MMFVCVNWIYGHKIKYFTYHLLNLSVQFCCFHFPRFSYILPDHGDCFQEYS